MAKKKLVKKNKLKREVPVKTASITDTINTEIIAAALSSVNQPVFLKVCRLCEAKDGPFLNIFDSDKITAKKIEVVMPFGIAENDDLPHKICFRCSAKVEELYEFIQKCIKTQENLKKAVGSKVPISSKSRHRELWEEKLNQSNISNDDICDALIKKAMEGIKDIPDNIIDENETPINKALKKTSIAAKEHNAPKVEEVPCTESDVPLKVIKDLKSQSTVKTLRSRTDNKTEIKLVENVKAKPEKVEIKKQEKPVKKPKLSTPVPDDPPIDTNKQTLQTNTFSLNETTKPPEPKFNIMDHVSMIKVNGVGVLFQCRLCNRNFLKKEVVMSHACAKNGLTKQAGPKTVAPPEPPKIPLVKYINTKTSPEVNKPATDNKTINLDDDDDKPLAAKKPKPRIGPASKIRQMNANNDVASKPSIQATLNVQQSPEIQDPVVQFPTIPSLNSRYKLVPGPNNTFTLVEEKITDNSPSPNKTDGSVVKPVSPNEPKVFPSKHMLGTKKSTPESPEIVNNPPRMPEVSPNQPYPVGLFKVPSTGAASVLQPQPVTFTTPAMKKQSYTVVQTGNPSKLLISSKPQNVVDELPKKRQRKTKQVVKNDETNQQPFSVTLEDAAPPRDAGFFTFINVDPLLQPSYVLPTDNIIQESQISTSSSVLKQNEKEKDAGNKYTCNMCNITFSREKKLLAHIQSHYSKMDEEDRARADKNPRKRKK